MIPNHVHIYSVFQIMKTMMNDHSNPNMWLPHSNSSNPYSNSTIPQWSPSSAQSQLNWTEVVQTITRYSTLNQQVSAAVEKFMYNPKLPALSAAFDTFINSTGNFMTSMQRLEIHSYHYDCKLFQLLFSSSSYPQPLNPCT